MFFFRLKLYLVLFISFFFSSICISQETEILKKIQLDLDNSNHSHYFPMQEIKKPKIGLALSGGGVRGIAHIGVLKVLEENNIPIDYIIGTSVGAIIGGLYSSGYTSDQLWKIVNEINLEQILNDSPARSSLLLGEKQKRGRSLIHFRIDNFQIAIPEAWTPGQKLNDILTELILNAPYHSNDFSQLHPPLKIVATDLLSGKKMIFEQGNLTEIIRASAAVPLLFTPIEIDSTIYIDGGILDNIPVMETKNSNVDIVIAVDTTSPLREKSNIQAPWEIADQVTSIMQIKHNEEQRNLADVVISLKNFKSTSSDYDGLEKFYQEGQKKTLEQIDIIKKLINQKNSSEQSESWYIKKVNIKNIAEPEHFTFIDTTGNLYISENDIKRTLGDLFKTGTYNNLYAEISRLENDDSELNYILEPTFIPEKFDISGYSIFPDSLITHYFNNMESKHLNYYNLNDSLDSLIHYYRNNGFSLAEIADVQFFEKEKNVKILISEGKIEKISLIGNKKTKDFVITRDLLLKTGTIFKWDLANKGIKNIYGSGLFNSVWINVNNINNSHHININLQEKPSLIFRLGANYNREQRTKIFAEIGDENIFGTGNDLTFHSLYGSRDLGLFTQLRADRIFKSYFTSSIKVHHNQNKHYAYQNFQGTGEYERRSTGTIMTLGRQIERFGTVSAFLRLEKIDIRTISGIGYDPGKLAVNTIGFRSIVDTRDQIPFTRFGSYHEFFYEISSGTFLGADISFFKFQNKLTNYYTLFKRHTLSTKINWGIADLTTPFSEQFREGGKDSFLGLREGELYGRHMLLTSLEYRYYQPIRGFFKTYLSLRYDFGSIWNDIVEIKAEDFISARGISLSFETPFGPLSVTYGKCSNDRERYYITAGHSF